MDIFTETVWEVITNNPELLEELTATMKQEHKPFLTTSQAFEADTNLIKSHIQEKFTRWLAWLPTIPIDQIGAALAEAAFELVEWKQIGKLLQEREAAKNLSESKK